MKIERLLKMRLKRRRFWTVLSFKQNKKFHEISTFYCMNIAGRVVKWCKNMKWNVQHDEISFDKKTPPSLRKRSLSKDLRRWLSFRIYLIFFGWRRGSFAWSQLRNKRSQNNLNHRENVNDMHKYQHQHDFFLSSLLSTVLLCFLSRATHSVRLGDRCVIGGAEGRVRYWV